jgi:hypothetical protein
VIHFFLGAFGGQGRSLRRDPGAVSGRANGERDSKQQRGAGIQALRQHATSNGF